MRKVLLDELRGASAPRLGGRRPHAPLRLVVQPRLPRASPHRLEHAGLGAGKAHRVRGGARDPRLSGPQAAPGARPPLLRVLPPRAAGGAAGVRGGRVRGRDARGRGAHPLPGKRRGRPAEGAMRGVLLDHELPGGAQGHFVRQLPHQAGGPGPARGTAEPAPVRDPFAHSGLPALAAGPASRASPWRPRAPMRLARPGRSGEGPGRGAARTARGAGGPLPGAPVGGGPRARSGGPVPPRQRRASRAHQLAGRHRRPRGCGSRSGSWSTTSMRSTTWSATTRAT